MFKKIILPLILLIFARQEFYGMEKINDSKEEKQKEEKEGELQKNKWWEFLENNMEKSSCLSYHVRALFDNFFRKWCGVYKRVEFSYGELYFGTVSGIGLQPQFFEFHEHFRMGFLEISYNLIASLYHIAIDFFTKGREIAFLNDFILGFSLNLINFKIYKGLIKLNFINPVLCSNYCETIIQERGFNPNGWKKYGGKNIHWSKILFFGKELKSISEIKNLWNTGQKKEAIIKVLFLVLNCILLPEIYIDINLFLKNTYR